ncbi:endo-1,3(4)-beta-glucanase [Martiniozyma asiatica (nom. inval.)]|nr:endo-1,3(4)-beta-glucanase [Martiniozyma asiatica]
MGLLNRLEDKFKQLNVKKDSSSLKFQPPPIPTRDYGQYKKTLEPQPQINASDDSDDKSNDIFSIPISTNKPNGIIKDYESHPVPLPSFYDTPGPLPTNNFYGNMLICEQGKPDAENQNLPVWTHPYGVWKCLDDQFKGLAISHTSASQRVFGDNPNDNPVKYFFNPVGICSMLLGAVEFQEFNFNFLVGECKRFSLGTKFIIDKGTLSVKLVQGMGFITGIYKGAITPKISSKVGVQSFQELGKVNGLNKCVFTLFDQSRWVVYTNTLFKMNNEHSYSAISTAGDKVIVQIAKLNSDDVICFYDKVAGAYVTDCSLTGNEIENNKAQYSFNYSINGTSESGAVLQWMLPHHCESATDETKNQQAVGLALDDTVKGIMSAFITKKFVCIETLPPVELNFDPWSENIGIFGYSDTAKRKIHQVAKIEISEFDVVSFSNTDSMYASGKILDKGAFMLYVAAFVLKDEELIQTMLNKMKTAFNRFTDNKQIAPLVYDTCWKGVVSSAGISEGNFYCDYGNCFYNDHHFHYGYHIHAAALVGLVDDKFGDKLFISKSKDWVETLIRDVCNPCENDTYFPVLRSFDFFAGHSYANGLFAHGDGKDEESSSEDFHCYYGIKLWSEITENRKLNTLASLILSIEKRAMGMYYYYLDNNNIMPAKFIKNKVSGIIFENKIDHATYFGMNTEYIHGIHMIPLTPISNFVRSCQFVGEEWDQKELCKLCDTLDSGWRGLLMLNLAIIDPKKSWEFFAQDNFNDCWLDNGMSRTWSLTYAAGMGGA